MALVSFKRWSVVKDNQTEVAVNPERVDSVVDYCGQIEPGCVITLKSKESFLVQGSFSEVTAKLNSSKE